MKSSYAMRLGNVKPSADFAKGVYEGRQSGTLLVNDDLQYAYTAPNNEQANDVAKGVLRDLKSGGMIRGTVRSLSKVGEVEVASVTVVFPVLGERQIMVRNENQRQIGQRVHIECVPNTSKPQGFVFQMAAIMGEASESIPS